MRTYDPSTPCPANRCVAFSGHRRSLPIGSLRILVALLVMTGGAVCLPRAAGGEIKYYIDDYPSLQNGYTITGSITTDGNTGTLSLLDLQSWNISVLKSGVTQFTLTPSDTSSIGVNITATTNALTVSAPGDSLFFAAEGISHEIVYSVGWSGPTTNNYAATDIFATGVFLWDSTWPAVNAVATVPEPSTIALLAMGALGAGAFIARNRSGDRRPQTRQQGA